MRIAWQFIAETDVPVDDKSEAAMQLQENTLTKIKRFEHLFQYGHRSVLIDSALSKLTEMELSELKRNLDDLDMRIVQLERQYAMSSREFSERFDSGELGDAADFVEWSAYADMRIQLIRKIDILVKRDS